MNVATSLRPPRASMGPYVALVALYLLWGTTYLAMRIAVASLPPYLLAGTRFVLAGATLLGVVRALGYELPTRSQWLLSVPLGALFFLIGNGLVVAAEKTLDSSIAAVVCAMTPLVAVGIGRFTGERSSRMELMGTVIGLVGVGVLAIGSPLASRGLRGLYVLLAPIGWAIASAIARRTGTTGVGTAAAQMVSGGLWLLAASFVAGESIPHVLPAKAVLAWAYLVVCGSLVGFTSFIYLLRKTRPAVAMSYAYVNPIIAVLVGAVAGGETIGWPTVIATTLIASGVMMAVVFRRPA